MANFDQALNYVIHNEGSGYSEVDQPTNTGIIAEDIAEWKMIPLASVRVEMIKDLSQEDIKSIYRLLYWDKIRGDEILDQGIATAILDTSVLRGLNAGIRYVERTCLILGYPLVIDGVLGFHVLAALNKIDRKQFINTYEHLVSAGYLAIVNEHPEDKKYLMGWMNRAKRLFSLI